MSDKYRNFPSKKNISVGEVCFLCECNNSVRKQVVLFAKQNWTHFYIKQTNTIYSSYSSFFHAKWLQWIEKNKGKRFSGINKQTNQEETFEIITIAKYMDTRYPNTKCIKRTHTQVSSLPMMRVY